MLGITEPASLLANTYELTVTAIPLGHQASTARLPEFVDRFSRRCFLAGDAPAKVRQALKQQNSDAGREWSARKAPTIIESQRRSTLGDSFDAEEPGILLYGSRRSCCQNLADQLRLEL